DLPRLVHQILDRHASNNGNAQTEALTALLAEQRRTNRLLSAALLFIGGFAVGIIATHVLAWLARHGPLDGPVLPWPSPPSSNPVTPPILLSGTSASAASTR
ncbi:hypothetical protein ABTK98_19195, partial [Acinetobacter baumannii]